jgi:hypothetical protein
MTVYRVYCTHSTTPPTPEPSLWASYCYEAMAEKVARDLLERFPGCGVQIRAEEEKS